MLFITVTVFQVTNDHNADANCTTRDVFFFTLISLLFPLRFSNLWAKKKNNNSYNNSAYFNNAYNMGSGEEDIEMKCNNPTYPPGYMPDQKPEEDNCATINDPPLSTNQSTAGVILKFPEAISEENSEAVATFNYRPLDS